MSSEHKPKDHFYAVIMAGGGGTRLWPLSRQHKPKQMLQLFEGRSLFQIAVERLLDNNSSFPAHHIYVVTIAEQAKMLQEQCPQIPLENYLIEPLPRGTASVIGLASLALQQRDQQAIMVVLTADHIIKNISSFLQLLDVAYETAKQDYLVTLGIKPSYPAIGYGYIQIGKKIESTLSLPIYQVAHFKEKPSIEQAEGFLATHDHLWNSGMFIWKTTHIMQEFAQQMPELHTALMRLADVWNTKSYTATVTEIWQQLQAETIDYGIMENAKKVVVIPAEELGWFDVGSWESLFDLYPSDKDGNIIQHQQYQKIDTKNTLVFSTQPERLIATIGIKDIIIVDTPEILFICRKDQAQEVRQIVNNLKNSSYL